MNYNVEIDSNSIHEFGKNIIVEGNNFISILDDVIHEVDEMETFLSTPTGKLLKERLSEYLNISRTLVNDKYIDYSNTIERIANIYDNTNDNIKKRVGI